MGVLRKNMKYGFMQGLVSSLWIVQRVCMHEAMMIVLSCCYRSSCIQQLLLWLGS